MTINHANQLDLGQVSYNGFLFPPALNSSVNCQPVYDDSGRSIMYMAYSIRIEFIVDLDHVGTLGEGGSENSAYPTGGSKGTIDNQIAYLRRRLCQPGRTLHIAKLGLGPDLFINEPNASTSPQPSNLWDVTWGPKPKSITWQPLGLNRAAKIVWECEVGLIECENVGAGYKEGRALDSTSSHKRARTLLPENIIQLCYNQTWDIDTTGATTKSYEAIIQTRGQINPADLRAVIDSADHYRIYFEPALSAGYLRSRSYRLDKSKTKLEISITDTEVDSDFPYPPGVVDINVDYSIASSLTGSAPVGGGMAGFHWWEATMMGSFTLGKGFHPAWRRIYPYYLIILLIRSRFNPNGGGERERLWRIRVDGASPGTRMPDPDFALPLNFELTESMFGREFSFIFTWAVVHEPENAPSALNFGGAPNIYVEDQHGMSAGGPELWTWDLWLDSVYGTGNDTTAYDWNFRTNMTIKVWEPPSPGDQGGVGEYVRFTVPILGYWKYHGAPYSNRGAEGQVYEGDARQEPCMPNPNFWYSRTPSGFSQTGSTRTVGLEGNTDPDHRCLVFQNNYELHELSGVATHQKLTTGTRTINQTQDGPGVGVIPGLLSPHTNRNGTHNNQKKGYNPAEDFVDITNNSVATAQVTTALPTYEVRMYGYRIDTGAAGPVPKQTKYGNAEMIKNRSKSNMEVIQPRGNAPLYKVMWENWYTIVGTPSHPNGYVYPNNPAITEHSTGSPAAGYIT